MTTREKWSFSVGRERHRLSSEGGMIINQPLESAGIV